MKPALVRLLASLYFLTSIAGSARAQEGPSEAALSAARHALDLRERELRLDLANQPLAAPGTLLGLGIPIALVLLPIGSILIADSTYADDYDEDYPEDYSSAKRERAIGIGLLAAGAAVVAGVVWGAITIHKRRHRRRRDEYELSAIAVQRTVLQHGILGQPLDEVPESRPRASLWTARGRKMLHGNVNAWFSSGRDIGGNRWGLSISPGFTYFLRDHLGLGGFVTLARDSSVFTYTQSRKDLTVGGGVRLLREYPLGERTSLWVWPYLAAVWQRSDFTIDGCGTYYNCYNGDNRLLLQLGIMLPLMVRLTDSWGFGAGPYFEYALGFWGSDVKSMGATTQLTGTF